MPFNPFSGWRITGTWADHMSYSLGGTDLPLPFGTALPAPASGTLRTSGGTGERKAGLIGTAGRRSIIDLDKPLGAMVAIVFQHQSRFGVDGKHYDEGEILGWSGASTIRSNGTINEWGSDVHLHIHGLDKNGNRVEFEKHIGSSSAAGNINPIPPSIPTEIGNLMKPIIIFGPVTKEAFPYLYNPYTGERHRLQPVELSAIRESKQGITEMTLGTQAEFDAIKKRAGSL